MLVQDVRADLRLAALPGLRSPHRFVPILIYVMGAPLVVHVIVSLVLLLVRLTVMWVCLADFAWLAVVPAAITEHAQGVGLCFARPGP